MPMRKRGIIGLVSDRMLWAWVIVCQLAGFIGAIFTAPAIGTWYAALAKPPFNPPGWVFAPVWTLLFFLMGVSAYLVWREGFGRKEVRTALSMFGVQLALNVLWSVLFFGLHSPLYALLDILLLWAAIFLTMRSFYAISRDAGFLLVPYLLWVSFALVLNLSIYLLNP